MFYPSQKVPKFTFSTVTNYFHSDTRAKIDIVEAALQDIPCNHIVGLVIYDLPGRDCAAKASNGELAVGELNVYKTEYIDREHKVFCRVSFLS